MNATVGIEKEVGVASDGVSTRFSAHSRQQSDAGNL
jgi:hypothetical protein